MNTSPDHCLLNNITTTRAKNIFLDSLDNKDFPDTEILKRQGCYFKININTYVKEILYNVDLSYTVVHIWNYCILITH